MVADSYGLPPDRSEFLEVLAEAIATGDRFVRRRVERGGQARYDRRHEWFEQHRARFADALG